MFDIGGTAERTKNTEHGLKPAKFGYWKCTYISLDTGNVFRISTERRNDLEYGTRTVAGYVLPLEMKTYTWNGGTN